MKVPDWLKVIGLWILLLGFMFVLAEVLGGVFSGRGRKDADVEYSGWND